MNRPILDPPVPYVGPVQQRFTPGTIIRVRGTLPSVAYRFNINLQCGPHTSPQDDIALNLSVRLLDGYIALNSLQNGIWDEEQRTFSMPIKRAESFEIFLMCEFSQYKVNINGQHVCEFPQRIHYDRITHLAIDGDVSIIQVSYESVASKNNSFSSAPLVNATDDFEIVNASRPSSGAGAAQSSSLGFVQPPSYDSVMAAGPPYPLGDTGTMPQPACSYPSSGNMPQPACPYPSSGNMSMPFNANPPCASFPLNAAPVGYAGVPQGAPVPLNAANSRFKPVTHNTCPPRWILCGVIVGAVFIGFIITIIKVSASVARF